LAQGDTYTPLGVSGNTLFYNDQTPSSSSSSSSSGSSTGVTSLYARDYTYLLTGQGAADSGANNPLCIGSDSVSQLQVFAGTLPDTSQDPEQQLSVYTGEPIALGVSNGSLVKYQRQVNPVTITSMSGTVIAMSGNTIYYNNGGSLYSLDLSWGGGTVTAGAPVMLTDKTTTISTDNNFGVDIAGNLLFFIKSALSQDDFTMELNSNVTDYMYCKVAADAISTDKEYFIGVVGANDLPSTTS